jgi:hypothetical protein
MNRGVLQSDLIVPTVQGAKMTTCTTTFVRKLAMQDYIRQAILLVLSTLPVDTEMRFFWQDGSQHMSMTLPGESEHVARLSRASSDVGVVVPTTMQ